MKSGITRIACLAAVTSFVVGGSVEARDRNTIMAPYYEEHGDYKDIRSHLRRQLRRDRPMSGDDYFTLAVTCTFEPPPSQSIILTLIDRSPCKDEVSTYFLEAGMNGTPEGFLELGTAMGPGSGGYLYTQLAYLLSNGDIALREQALGEMASMRSGLANAAQIDMQADALANQLVASGKYTARLDLPGEDTARLAQALGPQLDWLDFADAGRCRWSRSARDVLNGAYRLDETTNFSAAPATVRVPGINQPVRGRLTRPEPDAPNYVQVFVDFRGRWNGLTVLGLTDAFLEESHGVYGTGIRFAEPVETVAARLSELGFVVNPDGSERRQVDDVLRSEFVDGNGRRQVFEDIDGVITTISRDNGETVFLCNEVFEASYGR